MHTVSKNPKCETSDGSLSIQGEIAIRCRSSES